MRNRKLAEKMTQLENCWFHPFAGITLFRFNGFYLSLLLKAPRGNCCKYIGEIHYKIKVDIERF